MTALAPARPDTDLDALLDANEPGRRLLHLFCCDPAKTLCGLQGPPKGEVLDPPEHLKCTVCRDLMAHPCSPRCDYGEVPA